MVKPISYIIKNSMNPTVVLLLKVLGVAPFNVLHFTEQKIAQNQSCALFQ